ncbi:hypothetical protein ACHQM5_000788 [Ranunculus cassubicifolius]
MEASSSFQITILSAEDLRINGRPVKKNTFVTIETDANSSQCTTTAINGGSNPSWNEKLDFSLPLHVKSMRLVVKCKKGPSERTIGSVSIPFSDFFEDYVPANCLHFLSYRLRDQEGDRNGIVNISIRVKGEDHIVRAVSAARVQSGYRNSNACGWRPPSRNHRHDAYANNNGRIAIGIPVSKGYMVA